MRQQKGAPPVGLAFSKMTVLLGDLERLERGPPVAFAALHLEKGARRPAERRVGGESALGKLLGGFDLAGLLRLDEKPPEAEFSHLRLLKHALEGLTGGDRIVVELGGLSFEKEGQRLMGRIFLRDEPGLERCALVACASRENAASHRLLADPGAALDNPAGQPFRRGERQDAEPAEKSEGGERDQENDGGDEDARADIVAEPFYGQAPGPVRDPGQPGCGEYDNH